MDLKDYRNQINDIDDKLLDLFRQRMDVSAGIASFKKENRMAVQDLSRERQKLQDVADKLPAELKDYGVSLYSLLMELSKNYQDHIVSRESALARRVQEAVAGTEKLFPERAAVACQGVEGAYSQLAADKLFKHPNIFYFSNFEAVFNAIEKGLCSYGVLPLENSSAGSVNTVYDLMMRHSFYIVKSVRLKVDHNLLARPGTKLEDIKEIFSHEQAIGQCGRFLQSLHGVKLTRCENTAAAARMVSESGRGDVAALASRSCIELYQLECLRADVQNQGNNYTRFICFGKDLEIFPGADRTSLMAVLPHKPGSLYKLLQRFYALDINLTKLESRPMPERNFEFMFYFDIEGSVYSPQFPMLLAELPDICEEFTYLGSYSEVI